MIIACDLSPICNYFLILYSMAISNSLLHLQYQSITPPEILPRYITFNERQGPQLVALKKLVIDNYTTILNSASLCSRVAQLLYNYDVSTVVLDIPKRRQKEHAVHSTPCSILKPSSLVSNAFNCLPVALNICSAGVSQPIKMALYQKPGQRNRNKFCSSCVTLYIIPNHSE